MNLWKPRIEAAVFALTGNRNGKPFRHDYVDRTIEHMADLADASHASALAGGWVQCMNYPFLNVAPAQVNTFTTITSIMSPAPQPYIPAYTIEVGTRFRVRAWGAIQSAAGTATFTFGLGIGNALPTTAICAGAAGTPTTGPLPLWLEFEAVCLVAGAAATASIMGQGIQLGGTSTPTTPVLIPATAPTALTATWSTTVANAITVNSVCSASSGTNGITLYGASVEQLN